LIPDAQKKPPDESPAVFFTLATGEVRAALVACVFRDAHAQGAMVLSNSVSFESRETTDTLPL